MKTTLLKAVFLCAIVFSMNSCSSDSEDTATQVQDRNLITTYDYTPTEIEMAKVINDYRVAQGLNPLELINHVSYKSLEHNEYMIENNVVNHDQFQQRAANIIQVLGAVKVNENIAYNYQAPSGAMDAWLASPGHRANIEGDFTHFGISISVNPETGKKYYTNIFIKR